MMGVFRMRETEVGEKDGEIEQLRHDLQHIQAVVEAKDTQLQHKDGQIQRQAMELQEMTLQLNRQLREVQTLRQQAHEKDSEVHRQQRALQALRIQKDEQLAAAQQLQVEMDARIVQIQQQLRERDAEINRLQRELRDQTASREQNVARMQSPPQMPQMHPFSELTWRRLPDMPVAMQYPQSVTMDTAVYIADRGISRDIHRYDLQTKVWTKLPQYQGRYFTLTEHNHQLTLVGGRDWSTHKASNTVAVYSTSERRWKQPYPPMNTPRQYPAVSTYNQHLVVAGGCDDSWTDLPAVEILDTSTLHSQWLSATSLPVSCRIMSAAIIHSTLYLLGGTLDKQVLSVSLPALTQTGKPSEPWQTLPDAPLERSTAIAVCGSLLSVGGRHGRQRSSAIHVYDQVNNIWNKVGDLPTEQTYCACCLLPSGEMLFAGGEVDEYKWTSRMDVVSVNN